MNKLAHTISLVCHTSLAIGLASATLGCATDDGGAVGGDPSSSDGKADGVANDKRDGAACRILTKARGDEPTAEWLEIAGPSAKNVKDWTVLVESCGPAAFCEPPTGTLPARTESTCIGFERFRAPALAEIAKVSPALRAKVEGNVARTILAWPLRGGVNAVVDVELDNAAGEPTAYVTLTAGRRPVALPAQGATNDGVYSVWQIHGSHSYEWTAPEVVHADFFCADLDNSFFDSLISVAQRQANCAAKLDQAFTELAAAGVSVGARSEFVYPIQGLGDAHGTFEVPLGEEAAAASAVGASAADAWSRDGYRFTGQAVHPAFNAFQTEWYSSYVYEL
jgi:hypothetical protein